jgi:hypothetical protein
LIQITDEPPTPAETVACVGSSAFAVGAPTRGMEVTMFTRNVGTVDRVLRLVVGLAILSLLFWGPQTLWGLLGLVPIATALVGWCPAYRALGIRTCKTA